MPFHRGTLQDHHCRVESVLFSKAYLHFLTGHYCKKKTDADAAGFWLFINCVFNFCFFLIILLIDLFDY